MDGSNPSLQDPDHWRRRAQESRELAENFTEPELKRAMLDVARAYDQMAAKIARQRVGWSPVDQEC